mgnify:CR=1 FL=1
MHLLAAQAGGFVDDPAIVTRLAQDPADVVILSAADSTPTPSGLPSTSRSPGWASALRLTCFGCTSPNATRP